MLSQTKGIFLHHVKYGESSVIATIYTEKYGRQAYIINSVKGKNTGHKASLLQPLYILDMIVYHKDSREVQRIKEFKAMEILMTIPYDIRKSTQAIFIAELLYKLLHEQESNPDFFQFFENAIRFLDLSEENISNFHLFFLSRLTGFLGVSPHIADAPPDSFLDLRKGTCSRTEPSHPLYMDKTETQLFSQLVQLKINRFPELKINRETRKKLLLKIIEYYHQHFDSLGEIKSLPVLNEVFSD